MADTLKFRLSVSLGIAQTLAWASSYYIPAVMARPIAEGIGCPTSSVYAAFSMALIISAVTAPFAGRSVDRFGGKKVLAASSVWFALSLFFLSLAQGEVSLFLAWGGIGLAMGTGLYDMAFASVVRSYGHAAPPIIAGITLIGGFASTMGWPISHFLIETVGWRYALIAWACSHLFLGLPLYLSLMLPENTDNTEPERQSMEMGKKGQTGKVQAMVLLGTTFMFTSFCSGTMASHLPGLLQLFGVSVALSVLAGMAFGPSQVAARFFQLSLLRSLRPINTAILAVLIMPLGAICMIFFGPDIALLVGITHGFGNGIMTIIRGTLPLSIFGEQGYGRRQGLLLLPAGIAQACSPFLFSLCITALGKNALYVYISAAWIAVLLLLQLKRTTRE